MARWYRSGRYYGRNNNYYYRRNNYRRSGGSASRRSYGQYKAAKQQADNASVILNIPSQISAFNITKNFGTEQAPVLKQAGTYALNVYDLLRKSEFYQSYAQMYDEFKIDNVKIKLIPTKYNLTFGETNGYQSLTVYTAWDRTGLSAEQVFFVGNNIQANDDKWGSSAVGNVDGVYCTVGDAITTYSSSESRQISPASNTQITRWLKPKTINEKAAWISTTAIDKWYDAYDSTNGRYYGIPTYNLDGQFDMAKISQAQGQASVVSLISNSPAVKNNPAYLLEDPNLKFKPTLLVGVYPTVDGVTEEILDEANRVAFNIEADINVTFRGLRKASVVA